MAEPVFNTPMLYLYFSKEVKSYFICYRNNCCFLYPICFVLSYICYVSFWFDQLGCHLCQCFVCFILFCSLRCIVAFPRAFTPAVIQCHPPPPLTISRSSSPPSLSLHSLIAFCDKRLQQHCNVLPLHLSIFV